ncbi:MAG: acyltransferase [Kiritimatiellaceae bacterium]|nr:acyltransferase [Kiritimatiellaceae bacterium]
MRKQIARFFASRKGMNVETLNDWTAREWLGFAWLLGCRLLRGILVRLRLGKTSGLVLCEKKVRLLYPRCIRAGRSLSLEEGCEIVGLSKRGVVFGNRCTMGRFATIRPTNVLVDEAGEGLKMGDHSNIGAYSYIGCSGYIELGDNVMMGPRVNLLAENHNFERTDVPMKEQGVSRGTIIIEDDCWLGANCSVLSNVRIGRGSIVATGAVVTKDVPPYSIVAGVPARVIRSRVSTTLHPTDSGSRAIWVTGLSD